MYLKFQLLFAVYFVSLTISAHSKPNVVLIMTDDQDYTMDSLKSMKKLKRLLINEGTMFVNHFVTTPICCPSRSSILTGRYVHNNHAKNNSISGNCASNWWFEHQEPTNIGALMKSAGYVTMYAGKYLNQYGDPSTGGAAHVPPGWDWWHGLISPGSATYYYNYAMSVNGTHVQYGDKLKDYHQLVIQKAAVQFLNYKDKSKPFFMVITPTASHWPNTPLPQYKANFSSAQVPRTPDFNHHADDKHWLLRQPPSSLPQAVIAAADDEYRSRWRSLLAVDDMIELLVQHLHEMKVLDETYIIYTSDNGFHLGQFCLPSDKRQVYEFDVRVPLVIRGPKVQNQIRAEPTINLDLFPTILDIANNGPLPDWLDGESMKKLLKKTHLNLSWRRRFLIEYFGEGEPNGVSGCPNTVGMYGCSSTSAGCICEDAFNNTYACLRTIRPDENTMFCEFQDNENFIEYYDLSRDPFQLRNLAKSMAPSLKGYLKTLLKRLKQCSGSSCIQFENYSEWLV